MHGGARRQLVAGHARGSAERPIQRGGGRHTCNSGGGERPKGAVALETVCPALFSYSLKLQFYNRSSTTVSRLVECLNQRLPFGFWVVWGDISAGIARQVVVLTFIHTTATVRSHHTTG